MTKAARVLAVAAAGGGLLLLAFLLRKSEGPQVPPPVAPAPPVSPAAPAAALPRRPPLPPPRASEDAEDPRIRRWRSAVARHARSEVLELQSEFLSKEGEVRELLTALARGDADPRVRAFTVGVLGRFKAPPPEAFFVERAGDPHEYPRTSALEALERLGTAACLPTADRLASGDPAEAVRAAAARAAKAVRSR